MLEGVGVEVAGVQRGIGKLVVVELDQLDLQAITGGDLLDDVEDLLGGADGDADGDGLFLLRVGVGRADEGQGQGGGGEQVAGEGELVLPAGFEWDEWSLSLRNLWEKYLVGMRICGGD